jgi:hypothetical protein
MQICAKVDDPEGLGGYRPISLIRSLGKIFAKVLANPFASTLPHLISPNQSAFIKGRQIQDNSDTLWEQLGPFR